MENIGQYITKYVKGKTPKQLFEQQINGSEPYLSPDYLRNKANPEFYGIPSNKTVQVEDGEVIVLWDGSNAGEVFVSKKGILASTMVKLEFDKEELSKDYYSYSFQYLEYFLKAKTAGSGIPHADKGVIKRLNFFKPPKPEQTAIATILSKVDEAILATQNSIKAAEKLKKSLMQNLLSGKLKPDGTWRTEDEFYTDEKFGKYPKEWNFSRFKDYAVLQRGKDLTDNDVVAGKYPVVKSNGVQIYHNQYFVEPPGVVTGRSGTIGKAFYIEEQFWAHNTTLYVKDFKGNCPKFIYYLILRMDFRKYYAGTTVPTLNRNDIHRLKISIPKTFEEQEQIANLIDNSDQVIVDKQNKMEILQRLKKSLMQNLLTGKVRVDVEKILELCQKK
ncbi:MAG: restriction endonuclease subunit S [Paludibacter sp.]|nr:restriction endonuclease subunit S [Paludibacter sp.]